MKISNSKRQLAQLLIEAGVTQFPKDANWAAQDKCHERFSRNCGFYRARPVKPSAGCNSWSTAKGDYKGIVGAWIEVNTLIPNWHQTVLSRDEFNQIVAETVVHGEPDADGWIEWNGGERPVDGDELVVCKVRSGREWRDGKAIMAKVLRWRHTGGIADIIAYRLHKPEQAKTEPVAEAKPTIEQLAADYRNRKDYADRKQREADAANAEAEAKLAELVAAGNAIGLVISVAEKEPELVITDWQDLQVGDEIEVVKSKISAREGMVGVVSRLDKTDDLQPVRVIFDGKEYCSDWPTEWRFIRRPAK